MNYWFGEKLENSSAIKDPSFWKETSKRKLEISKTPIQTIINLLDAFSLHWIKPSTINDVVPQLVQESGFSEKEVRETLAVLPTLLNRESLEKRVRAEFIHSEVLDEFYKNPHTNVRVRAVPAGVLLHVTAGNVFLSSIDSLVMGFLTKNISLLKVSSQNKFFPQFFAEELNKFDQKKILSDKFAILHWKGGDKEIETLVKSKVNTIIAWGGEEMVESYRKDLPKSVKLLDFGPKISFQFITRAALTHKNIDVVCDKIVADVIPWDQSACSSPQNLYLQDGIDEKSFMNSLDQAFKRAPQGGKLSEDEATEILKETYRGHYSELMEDGKILSTPESHLLHAEKNKYIRPSPLHRSLILKTFKDDKDLYEHLEPFSYYLQSCSYLVNEDEKNDYLSTLAQTGIKRFAPLGTITWGMDGAPHDGRYVLRELVQFIGDEMRVVDYGEEIGAISSSTSLKKYFNEIPHPNGYIFASGGTTGEPKFVHFSYQEFDFMTDMLATNLRAQGVEKGMTVANLFVAGNLWSSFMAVEKALEKIGAIQLPIGGLCSMDNILTYLKKFKPQVIMGIPSLLVLNAEHGDKSGADITIPKVFYAGEALSPMRQEYLQKIWKTESFCSAGYASVDAGVIGYQCSHCLPGEHHLFSDLVDLKIIDDEAIITSICRNTLPIVNYRSGDRVSWLPDCTCGRKDKRFKLMGRIDNVIQIWSCRLLVNDVERSLKEMHHDVHTFQIVIKESREANVVREKLELHYEISGEPLDSEVLMETIYKHSRDLKDTIAFEDFKKEVILVPTGRGKIGRNGRTGKISIVLDQRH